MSMDNKPSFSKEAKRQWAGSRDQTLAVRSREKFFLDIPFYRTHRQGQNVKSPGNDNQNSFNCPQALYAREGYYLVPFVSSPLKCSVTNANSPLSFFENSNCMSHALEKNFVSDMAKIGFFVPDPTIRWLPSSVNTATSEVARNSVES